MYLSRAKASRKLPLPRKGTKYLARASSHLNSGVPVVIAIRDMLKLAKTSKEVKKMINERMIKINGKEVKDLKESIKLFNLLTIGETYKLTLSNFKKFDFEKVEDKSRIAKVINKKILGKKKIQLNLHDGTNILTDKLVKINDSIELDLKNKLIKIIKMEKGNELFIFSGKNAGKTGKLLEIDKNKIKIKVEGKILALGKSLLIVK
jgi:small subunit ribosomal protein S4e